MATIMGLAPLSKMEFWTFDKQSSSCVAGIAQMVILLGDVKFIALRRF